MHTSSLIKSNQPLFVILITLLGAFISGTIFLTGLNKNSSTISQIQVSNNDIVIESIDFQSPEILEQNEIIKGNLLSLTVEENLFFNYHIMFLIWILLFCILMSISFALAVPSWGYLADLRNLSGSKEQEKNALIFTLVSVVLILAFSFGSLFFKPSVMSFADVMEKTNILLFEPKIRMSLLIGFVLLPNFIPLFGIVLTNNSIPEMMKLESPRDLAKRFHQLNESLKFFLFVIAVVITLTTITTWFGRQAVLEALPEGVEKILPIEFVYLYGLAFTLFLAIIYIPIHFQLKRAGDLIIKNDAFLNQEPTSEKDTFKKSELLKIFSMESSWIDNMKVSFAILGPLLTTVVGEFIPL